MTQTLDVISVNIWQILVSLANLVLLFLAVRKFLYKPVRKMLSRRQENIDKQYSNAEKALTEAEASREEMQKKLDEAHKTGSEIITNATAKADQRSGKIIEEAEKKAQDIVLRAEEEALSEKQKAYEDIKTEIASVSSLMAEKILGRAITDEDLEGMTAEMIDAIGESDD